MSKIFIIAGNGSTNTISKKIQELYELDFTINVMKNGPDSKVDGKRLDKILTIPSWKSSNLIEKINYRTTEISPFDIVIVGFWKATLHVLDLYSTYKLNPDVTFIFVKETETESITNNRLDWRAFTEEKIATLQAENNVQLVYHPINDSSIAPIFELIGVPPVLTIAPVTTTSTIEVSILQCGQ
jgi:hypothetical protein